METIKWLLKDNAPGVAYVARQRLLGEDGTTRRMKSLRQRCNEYPPAARMPERVDDAIVADAYKLYQGAFWTLILLSEMRADGRDKRVSKLTEHVLNHQLPNGGFSMMGRRQHHELVCLTASVLRALVHLGYGEDQRVTRGYWRLAERTLAHDGVPCYHG